ncbi:uncharacterized protein LOC109123907 [Vitis vinifera]|uniref:Uncharacterized protein n=1 Tax=Vitis vinifera TaxID=29760 RepID=D7TSW1_VITVI|eukprot:XP_019080523.1 PREDICTED: uncharacterized protein LOC109123907 [Vitis vinifera]
MTYSLPAFSVVIKPSFKHSSHKRLQVRAQSYRDEGRSSNIVDANLRVLKERIDVVRMKERLERCCRHEYGWNYASGNDCKLQKDTEFSHLFDLVGLVGGFVSLTIFSGTVGLCLVSLLVHLNQ